MKTKTATAQEKAFDTVKFFRAVKEKIAAETAAMSFVEYSAFLARKVAEFNQSAQSSPKS